MLIILALLAVALTAFFIWQNNDIVITEIDYRDAYVPQAFDGFRILQVSDLQSKSFGRSQQTLLRLSAECQPDIIVITGDLMDGHSKNIEAAMDFAENAVEIAPIYYVSGNHEWLSGRYDELCGRLKTAGITVLDNSHIALKTGWIWCFRDMHTADRYGCRSSAGCSRRVRAGFPSTPAACIKWGILLWC